MSGVPVSRFTHERRMPKEDDPPFRGKGMELALTARRLHPHRDCTSVVLARRHGSSPSSGGHSSVGLYALKPNRTPSPYQQRPRQHPISMPRTLSIRRKVFLCRKTLHFSETWARRREIREILLRTRTGRAKSNTEPLRPVLAQAAGLPVQRIHGIMTKYPQDQGLDKRGSTRGRQRTGRNSGLRIGVSPCK